MKNKAITTFCLLCSVLCFAQNNDSGHRSFSTKFSFHSINQIGLLEGETGSAFQLQTINGVQYKTWFAGVGTGLDYYYFRTVPLFLDVRKNLFSRKNTPFLYADGGMNYPWLKSDAATYYANDFKKGAYYEAGIGYSITTKNSGTFICSVGFSEKRFSEDKNYNYAPVAYPLPYGYYPSDNTDRYDYQFKRISIKTGWIF